MNEYLLVTLLIISALCLYGILFLVCLLNVKRKEIIEKELSGVEK